VRSTTLSLPVRRISREAFNATSRVEAVPVSGERAQLRAAIIALIKPIPAAEFVVLPRLRDCQLVFHSAHRRVLAVLDLHPVFRSSGAVGPISALRDHPLEPELTGLAE
jgi:hypothetical protein